MADLSDGHLRGIAVQVGRAGILENDAFSLIAHKAGGSFHETGRPAHLLIGEFLLDKVGCLAGVSEDRDRRDGGTNDSA